MTDGRSTIEALHGSDGGSGMTQVFRLAEHGRTFSTRPTGAMLRDALVDASTAADEVTIDFDGVLAISYSFADEFAGQLAVWAEAGRVPFTPRFVGATAEVDRVLGRAFQNRVDGAHSPPVART
jgi:hypothetical protein